MVALIQSRSTTHSATASPLRSRENLHHRRRFGQHFSQSLQRARYYDPSSAEFTSRDPLEYVDGMSLYRSAMSLHFTDPMGQITLDVTQIKRDDLTVQLPPCSFFALSYRFELTSHHHLNDKLARSVAVFGEGFFEYFWVQEVRLFALCVDCHGAPRAAHFRVWEWFSPKRARGFTVRDGGEVGFHVEGYDFFDDWHQLGSNIITGRWPTEGDCGCDFFVRVTSYLGFGFFVDTNDVGVETGGVAAVGPSGSTILPPWMNPDSPRKGVVTILRETEHFWGYDVRCRPHTCVQLNVYGVTDGVPEPPEPPKPPEIGRE